MKNCSGRRRWNTGTITVAVVRSHRGMPWTGMPLRFTSSWNISECWDSSMISWWR